MYTAHLSFLTAICGAAQKDKFMVYAQENGAAVASIVLLGSTVALAYNAVHNMLLKRTSSVAVRFSIFSAIGISLVSMPPLTGNLWIYLGSRSRQGI